MMFKALAISLTVVPLTQAYMGSNPAARGFQQHAATRNLDALHEPHFRRNVGGVFIATGSPPTSEQTAAQSLDPVYECTPYNYEPILKLEPSYPQEWMTATIQPNDTEAKEAFARINATVAQLLPNDHIHPSYGHLGNWTPAAEAYNWTDPDCWWTWSGCTKPNPALGIPDDLISVPEPNTWGLAFDDGPNCSHNAFYDYLQANELKATMFYIGSNVFNWPFQAMRGLDDGHHICCHTWSHQYMTSFTNEEVFAELWYSRKILQDILNITVSCWRPPYGDVDNRVRLIAKEMNLTTFMWDHDTEDWKVNISGVTPQDIYNNYQNVIDGAGNGTYDDHGTITLTHELTNWTMSTFIHEAPNIMQAFKHVVPLASAFNWTHPYIGSDITYPTFEEFVSKGQSSANSTVNTTKTASESSAPTLKSDKSQTGSAGRTVAIGGLWMIASCLAALVV